VMICLPTANYKIPSYSLAGISKNIPGFHTIRSILLSTTLGPPSPRPSGVANDLLLVEGVAQVR
jgi:hypothetical protein